MNSCIHRLEKLLKDQWLLFLRLDENNRELLMRALQELLSGSALETRIEFAQMLQAEGSRANLVIHWKLRDVDSRGLLAHPEPLEWVGTVLLSRATAELMIGFVKQTGGARMRLSEVTRLVGFSNLDIEFDIES